MRHRCETCGTVDGHVPPDCPENVAPDELPEGLFEIGDRAFYTCRGCDQSVELECEIEEFDPDVPYCGGSLRCLP